MPATTDRLFALTVASNSRQQFVISRYVGVEPGDARYSNTIATRA